MTLTRAQLLKAAALWFVVAALIAYAAGCNPKPLCLYRAEDVTNVGTPAPGWEWVVYRARDEAPCVPVALSGPLPLGGRVEWVDGPFMSADRLVAGTSEAGHCSLDIKVERKATAQASALAHEIAHWYWAWCFDYRGEPSENAAMAAWIRQINR